jgi:phosphate transport system substrate-binding protein
MTSGCVVLAYNLPGVKERVRLPREVYPKIFLGKVTSWDDPAIVRANPGVKLPGLPITVVRRSDGSGTTYVLTNHLAAVSRDWKDGPGVGKSVNWPTGIGAKGNPGVAFTIEQTPGSLGYLEYSYTIHSGIATAVLENKAGAYVKPSITTARAALAEVKLPENLIGWVPDPEGRDSYPVVSFTWVLCRKVYEEKDVGEKLKKVLLYGIDKGQAYSADLGYVPLPESVAKRVRAAIESIEVGGDVSAARRRTASAH